MVKLSGINRKIAGLTAAIVLFTGVAAGFPINAEAKNEKAAVIRLEKTEGEVSLTDSSMVEKDMSDGMKLLNGNHLITEEASYAWNNLDDKKILKLDEVSEMELRRKHKKLEVLLRSGSVFFNVTEPLKDDESFNIRSSTMVTGIRGTCGWVRIIDGYTTRVYLLEGKLECKVLNPVDGQQKTVVITPGKYADFRVYDPENREVSCDIITEEYGREDVEPYVLAQLLGDDALLEKIYKQSKIDLRDLTAEEVERKLKAKQEETAAGMAKIREAQAAQDRNISKDPVWVKAPEEASVPPTPEPAKPAKEEEKPERTSDMKMPVGSRVPAPSPVPAATPAASSGSSSSTSSSSTPDNSIVRLTMPQTATTVQGYLNTSGVRQVILLPGSNPQTNTLDVDIAFTVPAGKTLTANAGVPVAVLSANSMTVNGTADLGDTLANGGAVTVNSSNTLRVTGLFTNTGAFHNTSSGRTVLSGGMSNAGNVVTAGALVTSSNIASNGSFTVSGGTLSPASAFAGTLLTISGGTLSVTGGTVSSACDNTISVTNSAATLTLSGGSIKNTKDGGGSMAVVQGVSLTALGTDIAGSTDNLLGAGVDPSNFGAASVYRNDQMFHLVLLNQVSAHRLISATVSPANGGSVNTVANGSYIEDGTSIPISVTPQTGWELTALNINDSSDNLISNIFASGRTSYTYAMPTQDIKIVAVFARKRFNVTFVDDDGTVLLPTAQYDYGTTVANINKPADPTKTPSGGYSYTFAGWSPALAEVTTNATYTATYTRQTAPSTPYNITANGTGGTLYVEDENWSSVTSAYPGAKINVYPDTSYEKISSLTVTKSDGSTVSVTNEGFGYYSFIMPSSDVTVNAQIVTVKYIDIPSTSGFVSSVTYDEDGYDVFPGDTIHVNVSMSNSNAYPITQTVSVTDSSGNAISGVTVANDGNGRYHFTMPNQNVQIRVAVRGTGSPIELRSGDWSLVSDALAMENVPKVILSATGSSSPAFYEFSRLFEVPTGKVLEIGSGFTAHLDKYNNTSFDLKISGSLINNGTLIWNGAVTGAGTFTNSGEVIQGPDATQTGTQVAGGTIYQAVKNRSASQYNYTYAIVRNGNEAVFYGNGTIWQRTPDTLCSRGLITSPEDITRAVIKGTVSGYPQNPFATSYIGKTSHVEEIIIEEGFTSLTQYLVGSEVQRVYIPRSTTTIWGAFTNAQNGLEIYYAGSEQEFNSITFGPSDRNDLNRCVIHYNSTY